MMTNDRRIADLPLSMNASDPSGTSGERQAGGQPLRGAPPPGGWAGLRFLVLVGLAGIGAVSLVYHLDLLGRMAYAVERGRLAADRDHLSELDSEETAALEQVSHAFSVVVAALRPSVVNIEATSVNRKLEAILGREFTRTGTGSGILIDESGHIVTNNHVVDDVRRIIVTLADGREFPARTIGVDPQTDIAVIKIDADRLHPARLGDSDRMKVGHLVLAIGSPFQLGHSVSQGIVSAIGRSDVSVDIDYQNWIQTDTPIQPGNSGGPLINVRGEVVGINTAIATESGRHEGVAFAIPSNTIRRVAEQLKKGEKVVRGYLGVSFEEISAQNAREFGLDDVSGAKVDQVLPSSPAEQAGLQADDIILAVDGEPVRSDHRLQEKIASIPPGAQAKLSILRDRQSRLITVTIGAQPEDFRARPVRRVPNRDSQPDERDGARGRRGTPNDNDGPIDDQSDKPSDRRRFAHLGLEIATVSPALKKRFRLDERFDSGAVVTWVEPDGAANSAGLARGDLIVAANDRRITNVRQLAQELSAEAVAEGVRLKIVSGGKEEQLVLRLP